MNDLTGQNNERNDERLHRERINDIPDWLWEVDTRGVITYSNRVVKDTLGYSSEEITGRSVFSLLVPEDIAKCRRVFEQAKEKQEPIRNVLGRFATKDDIIKTLEVSCVPLLDSQRQLAGFRGISRDATEFLAQQRAALEVEQNYRALVENSLTGIVIVQDERIVVANSAMTDLMGYTPEEALGAEAWQFIHPDDRERVKDYYNKRVTGQVSPHEYDVRVITKSGEVRYFELRATPIQYKGALAVLDNVIDITERKRAEDELRKRNADLEAILHAFPDIYFWLDAEDRIEGYHAIDPSELYVQPEQFIGKKFSDVLPSEAGAAFAEAISKVRASQCISSIEYGLLLQGELRWFEARLVPLPEDKKMAIVRDISDRKRAEESLWASEEKFRALVENTFDWIWEVDEEDRYVYVSPRVYDLLGYEPEEVLGRTPFELMPPDEAESVRRAYHSYIAKREPFWLLDNVNIHKDGHLVVLQTSGIPVIDDQGVFHGYRGMDRDITELKEAEKEIERANRALRVLSDCNQALVRATDEQELLDRICQVVVEVGGYCLAMVGFAEENEEKTVRLAAMTGKSEAYREHVDKLPISWADTEAGRGSAGTAIRTGQTIIIGDLWTDPRFEPWRKAAMTLGYQSEIGLPLTIDNRVVGALSIFAAEPDAFDREEVKLLEELAYDIAYGIQSLRNKKERDRVERELEESRRKLSNLMSNLPGMVYRCANDRDRTMEFVSEGSRALTGYEPSELIDSRLVSYGRLVFPDDRDRIWEEVQASLLEKSSYKIQYRVISKQGEVKWVSELGRGVYSSDDRLEALEGFIHDVTEQKQAEEALEQNRYLLRQVLDTNPSIIFVINWDFKIVLANQSLADFYGASVEELVGSKQTDIHAQAGMNPEEIAQWIADDRYVMETGNVRHVIERSTYRDGSVHWYRTSKYPIDVACEGKCVLIISEDITEAKVAQDALQEAEAKYRSLVEESLMGVYIIQEARFVYVNPRMAEIFGYSQDEMVGMPILDTVQPEYRRVAGENIQKRIEGAETSIRYSFAGLRKDGARVEVEVHGTRTIYRGKPAIIGTLADITERRQWEQALIESEERYRLLFENSPDTVLILDTDGRIIAMSPAVRIMLGYEPGEVIGKTPADFSPEYQLDGIRSDEKVRQYIEQLQIGGMQRFEWILRRKDGALVFADISLNAYTEHDKTYFQAIARDITDRKRTEEDRLRLEKRLEAQKRQFYRETIRSVTNGKLDIADEPDIHSYVVTAEMEEEVRSAAEVPVARHAVEEYLLERGLKPERLDLFMIGVGEAITNAIKHGIEGHVYAGATKDSVWVAVQDEGRGIESLILPQATLMRGFSTKPSLGLGYSIMLDVSDSIMLQTGSTGTTVILFKNLKEHTMRVSTEMLPDTWNSIPG